MNEKLLELFADWFQTYHKTFDLDLCKVSGNKWTLRKSMITDIKSKEGMVMEISFNRTKGL